LKEPSHLKILSSFSVTTVGMPVLMIDMTAIPQNRRATKKLAGDTGHGVEEDRELTDRLILEARNGCVDSFRQLVSLHHRKVRLFLARYIRCPSHVDGALSCRVQFLNLVVRGREE
jgi:hypothetical protein